jgi:hypothetical protein
MIIFKQIASLREDFYQLSNFETLPQRLQQRLTEEVSKAQERLLAEGVSNKDVTEIEDDIRELFAYKFSCTMELINFIKSFSWTSSPTVKEQVKFYLKSDYDCHKTAKHFNVSLNSMQVTVTRASKVVVSVIGENTLNIINNSTNNEEIDAALIPFRFSVDTAPDKFFIKEVVCKLPDAKYTDTLSIEDCKLELTSLKLCSIKAILKRLAQVDNQKMAHLLYILSSSDSNDSYKRVSLYRFLTGEINTVDALFQELRNENPYS